ncbi:10671_t:CDS:2 [Diversispora eburnea]|uniref:10671_t:CDS:1 n=1 Tax=Diversispora eburnea TaxID=1213867 RepID=A0A9N8W0W5_9GLOM|nr:10671_t:CDS:2 [Diversispora eburnea]
MEKLSGQQLIEKASKLISENKLDEAVKIFSYLVEKLPDAHLPLLSRCTCLIQLEKYEAALKDAKKMLDLPNIPFSDDVAPGNSTLHSVAYARAAKCYKELGQIEEAEKLLKKRVEIEKKEVPKSSPNNSVEKLRLQGNQSYKNRRYEDSLESYLKALEIDPNDLLVNSNCAQVLIKLGRFDDALIYAENCIRLNRTWSKGYYRKGCILFEQKKYQEALSTFTAAKVYGIDESDINKKVEFARKQLQKQAEFKKLESRSKKFSLIKNYITILTIIIAILSIIMYYFTDEIGNVTGHLISLIGRMFDAYFGDIW